MSSGSPLLVHGSVRSLLSNFDDIWDSRRELSVVRSMLYRDDSLTTGYLKPFYARLSVSGKSSPTSSVTQAKLLHPR